METRVDLEEHRIGIGDTTIELEDHQIGQLRQVADDGGFDPEAQQAALDTVVDHIRAFLDDCGRPITPVTVQQEAEEAFGVHLYLTAQDQQDPDPA